MRKLLISMAVVAGCAGGGAGSDSARSTPDSLVQGPPAVPSSLTPPPESAAVAPTKTQSGTKPAAIPPTSGEAPAATDSVRGIVSVVGTSFQRSVMVAVPGNRRVEITGPLAPLVGHVAGAEVSVFGALEGTKLEANRFVVRSVDGRSAIDGILETRDGALYIVTADGTRTHIAAPPPPLVGQDGARVWITGDPSKSVGSFGFINPPR